MKNLYKLKQNSLHVKFFKWIWGVNPMVEFKTMCPYFWGLFFTLLFFPIILFLIIINRGILIPLDKWFEKFKVNNKVKTIEKIKNNLPNKSDEELYDFYHSKCYNKYYYDLDDYTDIIRVGRYNHSEYLRKLNKKLNNNLDKIKYGVIGKLFGYLVWVTILGLIGWGIYVLVHLFTYSQFISLLIKLIICLSFITACVLIILGVSKLVNNSSCYSFTNKAWKWFKYPFNMLWWVILICADMIKNLYKQSCPLIIWEDE